MEDADKASASVCDAQEPPLLKKARTVEVGVAEVELVLVSLGGQETRICVSPTWTSSDVLSSVKGDKDGPAEERKLMLPNGDVWCAGKTVQDLGLATGSALQIVKLKKRWYTQVAAGDYHTVLLRSDGTVIVCGDNSQGQCRIPTLEGEAEYTQVSAGYGHTVLLKSDGSAVACGNNSSGQCSIPALEGEAKYTQVAAGFDHTVLLKSDGSAIACGPNRYPQCIIPALRGEAKYTQVAAGESHTVLLKSDGSAIACGDNYKGDFYGGCCTIPALEADARLCHCDACADCMEFHLAACRSAQR